MFAFALPALKIQTCDRAVGMRGTANGFVRVWARTGDIPGNCLSRNPLTVQEQATPGNAVKYFEVLAGGNLVGVQVPLSAPNISIT